MERSPWWGGHFEQLVGSVKRCLKKVLGNAMLRYDELLTLLTQVESTLNSRPLTYIYDEFGYHALTPFHLMHGRHLSAFSDHFEFDIDALEEDPSSFTRRFAYLVKKLDHFWSRWRLEYLADLREVHHLNKGQQGTVHIGEMVLVKEDNVKRSNWKMGVIIQLITGKDGIARGAKVRIGHKGKHQILTRSLQCLLPLEIRSVVADENSEKRGVNESKENDNPAPQGLAKDRNVQQLRMRSGRPVWFLILNESRRGVYRNFPSTAMRCGVYHHCVTYCSFKYQILQCAITTCGDFV